MRDLLQWSSLLLLFLVLPFSLISCDSSGSNGSNEPDFNQVTVESIILEDFPFTTDSGDPWDFTSAPDPGIRILKGENGSVVTETGSFNNIGRDAFPLEYANTSFTTDDLSAEYSFDLYDVDNGEPDFIGGVVYSFSNLTDSYPESKTIEAGGVRYTLELNWSE